MIHSVYRRTGMVVQGMAQNISVPLFGLLVSWMVIHLQNAPLWGEFVRIQVWVLMALQVLAFGNRDYLLLSFSKSPARMAYNWSRSFFSRAVFLLLAVTVFVLLPVRVPYKGWIVAWCIVRFVYQSFDVVIQYQRRYGSAIVAELLGLLLLFVALYRPLAHPSAGWVLKIFVMADLLKTGFLLLVIKGLVDETYFKKFNLGYFRSALPFLMMTLAGYLVSRIDLLCVNYILKPRSIAFYQVLTALLGFMQLGASMLLSPFMKNIYRLSPDRTHRLARNYRRAGLLIVAAQAAAVYAGLRFFFHFDVQPVLVMLSYGYLLPFYFYYTEMIRLTVEGRQHVTVAILLTCAAANAAGTFLLAPQYQAAGALAAAALAQWLIFLLFRLKPRRPVRGAAAA